MWKPILSGAEALRAQEIASEIADRLASKSGERALRDAFGPLLDAYLARTSASERHADRALRAIEEIFAAARTRTDMPAALFGGLAGLGWIATHVRRLFVAEMEPDDDDACVDIDVALLDWTKFNRARGPYDLISGLCGFAVYAFERMPNPACEVLIAEIVKALADGAEAMNEGVSWRTRAELLSPSDRLAAPTGYFNLGVAHGVPAVAVVMSRAARLGIQVDLASSLLDRLVTWLLAQQRDVGPGARFPPWTLRSGSELPAGREAWCYGGLGLSVALLSAARSVGNLQWERVAVGFALAEAARSRSSSGVADMCLCHGGAGNAHLYNRLYQATGDEAFAAAARRWLLEVIGSRTDCDDGGYVFLRPLDPLQPLGELGLVPDLSFLNGIAGVGLALLAGASPVAPEWDRVLMADVDVKSPEET